VYRADRTIKDYVGGDVYAEPSLSPDFVVKISDFFRPAMGR